MEQQNSKLQESCLAFAKVLLAAGTVWKDSTSYSRDDKNRIPTDFSAASCAVNSLPIHLVSNPSS